MGKESENSYQKLKRSPRDRHTKTHGNCIEIFRLARPSLSIGIVNPIDKDSRASRNISIQFLCVYPPVISSISGKEFSLSFPLFCDFRTLVLSFPRGLKISLIWQKSIYWQSWTSFFVVLQCDISLWIDWNVIRNYC